MADIYHCLSHPIFVFRTTYFPFHFPAFRSVHSKKKYIYIEDFALLPGDVPSKMSVFTFSGDSILWKYRAPGHRGAKVWRCLGCKTRTAGCTDGAQTWSLTKTRIERVRATQPKMGRVMFKGASTGALPKKVFSTVNCIRILGASGFRTNELWSEEPGHSHYLKFSKLGPLLKSAFENFLKCLPPPLVGINVRPW